MKTLHSPTIVDLEGEDYYVIAINGDSARLTPCNPRYGVQGDTYVSAEDFEYERCKIKEAPKSLDISGEEWEFDLTL